MENKIVTTNPVNENIVLSKYTLFEWKCEKKENIGRKVIFTFSRDDSKPYHEELVKFEKEFGNYHIGTMIPTYILAGLSFILMTVFFILHLIDKDNFVLYFFTISIPALFCLLAASAFTIVRFVIINKIVKKMPEKIRLYSDRIKDLKSKY